MSKLTSADVFAGLLAAVLVGAFGYLGLAERFGAHPQWAVQVIYIGIPLGLVYSAIIRTNGLRRSTRLVLTATLFLCAMAVTVYGQRRFVESFGEDRFGGDMWFFGWIASAAFATALIARLVTRSPD